MIWTKIKIWLALAGWFAASIAAFFLYGRHKGAEDQAARDTASHAEADQKAAQAAAETAQKSADAVKETRDEISKMPAAGTQRVGDAVPGSAADWLRQYANRDS